MPENNPTNTLYHQLGSIEGKLDAQLRELQRLHAEVGDLRTEVKSRYLMLEGRVLKIEKDQIRQHTMTITIASVVSFFIMTLSLALEWGSKILR